MHPFAGATSHPLDRYQPPTCNKIPAPPLQICFMCFTKAPWPTVTPRRTGTGLRLSVPTADAWYHAPAVAQDLAPPLRRAISHFIAGEGVCGKARPGSGEGVGAASAGFLHWEAYRHPCPTTSRASSSAAVGREAKAREKDTNTGEKRPRRGATAPGKGDGEGTGPPPPLRPASEAAGRRAQATPPAGGKGRPPARQASPRAPPPSRHHLECGQEKRRCSP